MSTELLASAALQKIQAARYLDSSLRIGLHMLPKDDATLQRYRTITTDTLDHWDKLRKDAKTDEEKAYVAIVCLQCILLTLEKIVEQLKSPFVKQGMLRFSNELNHLLP